MMKKTLFAAALAAFIVGCQGQKTDETATGGTAAPSPEASTGVESSTASGPRVITFAEIQPIFKEKCIGCHGESNPKEGISLVSYEAVMKGGEHGPTVVAGQPENSLLIHALRGTHGKKQMPPKMDPLPEEQINKIEAWIKEGAKS
jgi:mono/diheme cytochrome c family protein